MHAMELSLKLAGKQLSDGSRSLSGADSYRSLERAGSFANDTSLSGNHLLCTYLLSINYGEGIGNGGLWVVNNVAFGKYYSND